MHELNGRDLAFCLDVGQFVADQYGGDEWLARATCEEMMYTGDVDRYLDVPVAAYQVCLRLGLV